jgi:NAD(P)-dependent dehydrogenase (short-subunit alcohol dehydrogenase family)
VSQALDPIAEPEEVAGAYSFVAGPDADYLAGRNLPVDSCVF